MSTRLKIKLSRPVTMLSDWSIKAKPLGSASTSIESPSLPQSVEQEYCRLAETFTAVPYKSKRNLIELSGSISAAVVTRHDVSAISKDDGGECRGHKSFHFPENTQVKWLYSETNSNWDEAKAIPRKWKRSSVIRPEGAEKYSFVEIPQSVLTPENNFKVFVRAVVTTLNKNLLLDTFNEQDARVLRMEIKEIPVTFTIGNNRDTEITYAIRPSCATEEKDIAKNTLTLDAPILAYRKATSNTFAGAFDLFKSPFYTQKWGRDIVLCDDNSDKRSVTIVTDSNSPLKFGNHNPRQESYSRSYLQINEDGSNNLLSINPNTYNIGTYPTQHDANNASFYMRPNNPPNAYSVVHGKKYWDKSTLRNDFSMTEVEKTTTSDILWKRDLAKGIVKESNTVKVWDALEFQYQPADVNSVSPDENNWQTVYVTSSHGGNASTVPTSSIIRLQNGNWTTGWRGFTGKTFNNYSEPSYYANGFYRARFKPVVEVLTRESLGYSNVMLGGMPFTPWSRPIKLINGEPA